MKIGAVIMASGFSRRMGENKLLLMYKGKTFIENITDKILECDFYKTVLVTSYLEIKEIIKNYTESNDNFFITINEDSALGISQSIKQGLKVIGECDAYMFFTGDQPGLSLETIRKLVEKAGKDKIIIPKYNGKNGSPVIFGSDFYDGLIRLEGDSGGKQIINLHKKNIEYIEIKNSIEGFDIDTKEDYEYFISKI
jgi:molybdenum cofactor cytidylyltransferase